MEAFIRGHVDWWGTEKLEVEIYWGLQQKPLPADVVALRLKGNPQLALDGHGNPLQTMNHSPPLGIPLQDMAGIEKKYQDYVQDLVENFLPRYVDIAYDDQESMLPERLLGLICSFYAQSKKPTEVIFLCTNFETKANVYRTTFFGVRLRCM